MNSWTKLKTVFTETRDELMRNDPLRLAGATAFFTTFALPPILFILMQLMGLFFDPRNIGRQLFGQLSEIIGEETTRQIIEVMIAIRKMAMNPLITIGGFIFLLFVATTLFKVIKSSLNQVWKIRIKRKQKVKQIMRSRLEGLLVILFAGILFLVGLVGDAAQVILGKYIGKLLPNFAFYFNGVLQYIISIAIVTAWFALVFHFLPDGRTTWKNKITGAFFTSILFNIGKFILRWALSYSSINNIYGASASIVLLLLFVFYTSMIVYCGATFTKVWASHSKDPIRPLPHAVQYELRETDIN